MNLLLSFMAWFLLQNTCMSSVSDVEKNRVKNRIRKSLLADYDPVIGPVRFGGKSSLSVEFTMLVSKLIEVNTKSQTLKIDVWVKQAWNDFFLRWPRNKNYSYIYNTLFTPKEIWVPDVTLINNADIVGGGTKFHGNVVVKYYGECTWRSPASFTSSCKLSVRYWPFDTQVCVLTFGSLTHESKNIKIVTENNTQDLDALENGEWRVDSIRSYTGITTHSTKKYSIINLEVTVTRKPQYILFYLTPPAAILVVLTLMSFLIPTESGERIGFITTLMLTMMVFLLLIPEYLPRSSDDLPILGVLMIAGMVMIAVVLMATILILRCYHRSGTPSPGIQKLVRGFKFKLKRQVSSTPVAKDNEGHEDFEEIEMEKTKSLKPFQAFGGEREVTWQEFSDKMNFVVLVTCIVVCSASCLFIIFSR